MRSLLWIVASPLLALASQITLQSARVAVLSEDGSPASSELLSLETKLEPHVALGPSQTLRISFTVLDKNSGKGVVPHQTFLRLYDSATHEEGVHPIKVNAGGKGKIDINMKKPPVWLPPTTDAPIQVQLIIGSFTYDPFEHTLFDLQLPRSQPAPQHPDEKMYGVQPEIAHTFRPEQKIPPKFMSLVFALATLSPWAVLLRLWTALPHNAPKLKDSHIAPFVLLLAAFEALLVRYWIGLKLPQVLFYGTILGIVTAAAGKRALVATGKWRLQATS